ncbi:MAG TPA: class I SAM-dependent methyltransferase [Solirubrobacteraceae bacterium]
MPSDGPQFARDPGVAAYYDRRAPEYDDWYEGRGQFAGRDRPGWREEVDAVVALVGGLAPGRTLDVACGSGFLTRHLRGLVVGLDQSRRMAALTQERVRAGVVVVGDGLNLPFADDTFDRVLTGHFYGHLPADERAAFLAEADRVAGELVIIDSARRPGVAPEQWEERVLDDGSRHRVYKRYLNGAQLAGEIGGEIVLDGSWFVAARTRPASG